MQHTSHYDFWVKLASRASVVTALTLIVIKFIAWLYSDSASMMASLTDSFADALASMVNLIAIHYALVPADDDHSFGHGKAEPLASLAQSIFIMASALLLLIHGTERLIDPQPLHDASIGVVVSAIAIVLTLGLVILQKRAFNATGSCVVAADSLHYKSDLLLNSAVLIALVLTHFGQLWADGLFALIIALYIGIQAIKLAYDSIHVLLDRELDDSIRDHIIELATQDPRIQGYHDLRTRRSGKMMFIQLHLMLDGDLSLHDAHEIADQAEKRIHNEFTDAEVFVHQEPV